MQHEPHDQSRHGGHGPWQRSKPHRRDGQRPGLSVVTQSGERHVDGRGNGEQRHVGGRLGKDQSLISLLEFVAHQALLLRVQSVETSASANCDPRRPLQARVRLWPSACRRWVRRNYGIVSNLPTRRVDERVLIWLENAKRTPCAGWGHPRAARG